MEPEHVSLFIDDRTVFPEKNESIERNHKITEL